MRGITFNNLPPIRPPEPGRMDVALFVGFAPLARVPLFSDTMKRWLADYGWARADIDCLSGNPRAILNTPVPLESWDAFCAVFDDKRLDRQGVLCGRPLKDPLLIGEADRVLHVIVDRRDIAAALSPDADGTLSLASLTDQINSQFGEDVSALIDPETNANLILKRTDRVHKGELTVYANKSLGFSGSVQADSFYVRNYAGAAIRAFFRQGGKKCYFLSMGDPLPYEAGEADKCRQLYTLIWGKEKAADVFKNATSCRCSDLSRMFFPEIPGPASPVRDWQGLSHLAGLSDVTYVCFPDLVDVLGGPVEEEPTPLIREDKEVFAVCSETLQEEQSYFSRTVRAPLYDEDAYRVWMRVIGHLLGYLSSCAATVQLVASLPLPGKKVRTSFSRFICRDLLADPQDDEIKMRHLQLAFPWLKTRQSGGLPESLEPPEGILTGLLAAGARKIGAYRSIAGSLVDSVYDLSPSGLDAYSPADESGLCPADRICWFDFVPDGVALQSDVTAAVKENYRYGAVRRMMMLVQRAAYRIGLDHVFEPASERLWQTVRESLRALLHSIYLQNGLRGKSPKDAYSVSCGRSTMTQNDMDNGRLIANVTLQPAIPIERIAVDVLLERDGTVMLETSDS